MPKKGPLLGEELQGHFYSFQSLWRCCIEWISRFIWTKTHCRWLLRLQVSNGTSRARIAGFSFGFFTSRRIWLFVYYSSLPITNNFLICFSCSWLSILVMLAYMGTVIVILLNILIAQMSTTYIQAKKVARLEYDVDRILQLTRMERFPFLVC